MNKTEEKNEKFEKADIFEKRVILAQEVIDLIKIGKMIPLKGDYFTTNEIEEKKSLQKALEEPDFTCEVCGIGGLFVACTLYKNEVNIDTDGRVDIFIGRYDLEHCKNDFKNGFKDIFDVELLQDIERAFEGWSGGGQWINKYSSSKERLIAIMENIIKNKGKWLDYSPIDLS